MDYKRALLNYPHQSTILVLSRDSGSGQVSEVGGLPWIEYDMSSKDSRSLLSGLKHACKILIAAGAIALQVTVQGLRSYTCNELGIQDPGF